MITAEAYGNIFDGFVKHPVSAPAAQTQISDFYEAVVFGYGNNKQPASPWQPDTGSWFPQSRT